MFRHTAAIFRGSWVSDKLLKQCPVSWACADYDPCRVASCRGTGCTLMWHNRNIKVFLFYLCIKLWLVPDISSCPCDTMVWRNTYHSFSNLSHDRSKASPKRALHIVRSRASSFRCECPFLSLRSYILRLLPRRPVTSIPPFFVPSIICRWRQFLSKIWLFHLALKEHKFLKYTSVYSPLIPNFTIDISRYHQVLNHS
jgi:hypothetical protein